MRSLMLAAGVALLALNFAGCSSSVSSCGDMGPMGGNCGPTCTTCDGGCDSGCDSCQGGMGIQRPMVIARLRDRMASAKATTDCGCSTSMGDCGCSTSMGDCGCASSPAPAMGNGLGLGLFEKGPSCTSQGCDGNCGGQCGGPMFTGKVRERLSGVGSKLGSRIGCGMGGCGMGGNLCDGCNAGLGSRLGGLGSKLGALKGCGKLGCGLHGRLCKGCRGGGAGSIPHREPQGPGAGQVPSYVYPYYTTRAPRDFLMDNPPTIGY